MEKRELKLDYEVYKNSFPDAYEEICKKALKAAGEAYSIYSGFSVGAAVLLDNEEIVTANNQENIAYPSGMCAERIALFYAGAHWPQTGVKALAIAAKYQGRQTESYVSPCGACRQVFAEVIKRYGKDFDVVLMGCSESVLLKASALLPFSFDF